MSKSIVPRSSKPFAPPKTVNNSKLTGTAIKPPSIHSLGSTLKPPSQIKPSGKKGKKKGSSKKQPNIAKEIAKALKGKPTPSGNVSRALAKALSGKTSGKATSPIKALPLVKAGKATPIVLPKGGK